MKGTSRQSVQIACQDVALGPHLRALVSLPRVTYVEGISSACVRASACVLPRACFRVRASPTNDRQPESDKFDKFSLRDLHRLTGGPLHRLNLTNPTAAVGAVSV